MIHNIRGENIEVTEAIRDYVTKKIEKLERYFDSPIEATAYTKIKVYNDSQTVEITIPLKNIVLRAEEHNSDLYASVDLTVDKLERQVRKYKTRIHRKKRFDSPDFDLLFQNNSEVPEDFYVDEETKEFNIIRTKRFAFKPMSPEEAILQMNMLGHQFFAFLDAKTNDLNIVYKRKDESYGLIGPEY